MKVLITGGAGFIGYHLARFHLAHHDTVIVIDNLSKTQGVSDPELQQLLEHPALQLIRHDLTTPLRGHDDILSHLDVVYHLAAINGTQLFYDIPYQVARTNLLATLNLLECLASCQVGALVYSSTSEVYADAEQFHLLKIPTDEHVPVVFAQPTQVRFSYGTSKFMGEMLCRQFGTQYHVPCTVVRYHNIYGPRMGTRHVIPEMMARIRRRENPLDIYGGHETRAFCYIDDAVEATYRVATTPACQGEILHLGNSTQEIPIADLATLLMELMGFQASLRERGSRAGSVSRRCPDTSKLQALTDFQAKVGLREGLMRTIEWSLTVPEDSQPMKQHW